MEVVSWGKRAFRMPALTRNFNTLELSKLPRSVLHYTIGFALRMRDDANSDELKQGEAKLAIQQQPRQLAYPKPVSAC